MTRPRVLVVEDSLTIRMDLSEALSEAGLDVLGCPDLASARRALESGGAALVVLDLMLPDGDGLSFLAELKAAARTARTPVMLLSSNAEVTSRIRGMGAGADEYVGKPYEIGNVVARALALAGAHRGALFASTRRVLIIDDSPTFRAELNDALRSAGYAVDEATTGEEGLASAALRRPDAVVVDCMLPGIDGLTVVRRLRTDAALREMRCLVLTTTEGVDAELRALEAGADGYARKGEDLGVILVRLAALLRGADQAGREDGPSLHAPKRLLAVDDSPTYLEALGTVLREEGYDVVLAMNGEDALRLLAVQPVDCVLLDVVMPGLSGRDTCRRIKQTPEWRDIPLVMLTAREDHASMIDGINAGADDYISKSADFAILKARLRAQLRRKHFENENRRIREELVRRELATQNLDRLQAYADALEQSNRELEEARSLAEQRSQSKSRFLAGASHELRTPLNAILGFAQIIRDGAVKPEDSEYHEFLDLILTSGKHLLQLVNDLLDIAAIEAGKLESRPETVSLVETVNEVLALVARAAEMKQLGIKTLLDPSVDSIFMDARRLKQILLNYVSNAVKFTPAAGFVTIRARLEGTDLVLVEVEDSGIGIPESAQVKLFSEFERVPTGGKGAEGTGLGLALTKRLVESLGGSVGVRSQPGNGSTFWAILPLKAPSQGGS